jgi:tRNA(Ile)-lysidine synthase
MKQATIIDNVSAYITRYALIPHGTTIIVGLSGGPDSMFLLHALSQLRDALNIKIIAAHFDHEWRPTSSNFAKNKCKCLTLNLYTRL